MVVGFNCPLDTSNFDWGGVQQICIIPQWNQYGNLPLSYGYV